MKTLALLVLGAAAGAAACLAVLAMPVPQAPGGELSADEAAAYTELFGEGSR